MTRQRDIFRGCFIQLIWNSLPFSWSGWRRDKGLSWYLSVWKHTRQCWHCSPFSFLLLNKSCWLCLHLSSLSEFKAEVESYTKLWAGARMNHPVGILGAETSRQTLLHRDLLLTPLSLHTPCHQDFLLAAILPFISILQKHFCFLWIVTCKPCKDSEKLKQQEFFLSKEGSPQRTIAYSHLCLRSCQNNKILRHKQT